MDIPTIDNFLGTPIEKWIDLDKIIHAYFGGDIDRVINFLSNEDSTVSHLIDQNVKLKMKLCKIKEILTEGEPKCISA